MPESSHESDLGLSDQSKSISTPTFGQTIGVWSKIGLVSFGGPAAQIALLEKELVEDRAWLSKQQFLNALSFCMMLPGPEAMQLATYAGWKLNGITGGLIAGLLFVLPGALIIMVLASFYSLYGNLQVVESLFYGVKAAVLAIVIGAVMRLGKMAATKPLHWTIAILAFIGIFFLSIPFPFIVLSAGIVGWFSTKPVRVQSLGSKECVISARATSKTIFIWILIWLSPIFGLGSFGASDLLFDIGVFFSKLAVVTFGGAYAVIAYMAQDVVVLQGWLTADEMLDALALAETTPGPLILVTQFVAFIAGFKEGGLFIGLIAACLALWVTFIPCFLWIFVGAPYVEVMSSQPRLAGALAGVTAAVLGVILNLSLWFLIHVLFADLTRVKWGAVVIWRPDVSSFEWAALIILTITSMLVFLLHWGIIRVLMSGAVLGVVLKSVFLFYSDLHLLLFVHG